MAHCVFRIPLFYGQVSLYPGNHLNLLINFLNEVIVNKNRPKKIVKKRNPKLFVYLNT